MLKQQTFSKNILSNQKFIYTYSMSVAIGDMNYGNHLAATAVPLMLHQVRLKFLMTHGFSEINIGGAGLVVADLYVNYQCESFFDDQLIFQLGVEEVGKHSVILVYRIDNQTQKKRMGVAKEKIVFFDFLTKKISQTPTVFIELIDRLQKENPCSPINSNS